MNVRMPVASAGFDQKHLRAFVLSKPIGEHAARRSGADDDVVVTCGRHGFRLAVGRVPFNPPASWNETVDNAEFSIGPA